MWGTVERMTLDNLRLYQLKQNVKTKLECKLFHIKESKMILKYLYEYYLHFIQYIIYYVTRLVEYDFFFIGVTSINTTERTIL